MSVYLMLALAILAEVVGTSALRASAGCTRLLPSVLGDAAAFFLICRGLTVLPLGLTSAIWSGVGAGLTAVIGWLSFRDAFYWLALGGIGFIVVGMALLHRSGGARH
ncbi:DMT family transporter [Deinococcus sonorensis]|uniref:SMR family transporter n=2 Tax=Deinococcus sonorensis TaxID=309891 RepID=A0AAU7UAS8_9DEIO